MVLAMPAALQAQQRPDFLFGRPLFTFGVRAGYAQPMEDSEIFDFVQKHLTLEEGDFGALTLGMELAIRVSERMDLAIGVEHAKGERRSEFRDWLDLDDNPIEQATTFTRYPATVSARFYLVPRGRRISEYAWVPRSWAPYVAGGAGYVWYTFRQDGDFVDYDTLDIYNAYYASRGRATTYHVAAGVDLNLSRHFLGRVEARYDRAAADMSEDFLYFDAIDLSGWRVSVGVSARLSGRGT